MELSQLNLFVKVVQLGSFTRAADLLGTQKAYVSRVIRQLEQEHGVRLLDRTTRSLSLTEVGRDLFERSLRIIDAVNDAQAAIQQQNQHPQGKLKITCGVEFGLIAVASWVNTYLAQYPLVNVEADFTNRVVDMVHEGFDLAIRLGHLKDSSLVVSKLGEMSYQLYAQPQWLEKQQKITHPEHLHNVPICLFSGGNAKHLWHFTNRQSNEQVAITLLPRLQVNNSFAVRDALVSGLGIGLLPVAIASSCVARKTLVPLLEDWLIPTVPIHAVFPSSRYLTPKVRAFIDLAKLHL